MSLGAFRGDNSYDLVLLLHILTAIIGFGAVFLNGLYGAQVRARRGSEGLAILQANFLVAQWGPTSSTPCSCSALCSCS